MKGKNVLLKRGKNVPFNRGKSVKCFIVYIVDAAPDVVLDVADLEGHTFLAWLPEVLVERLADDFLVLVHHPQQPLQLFHSPFYRSRAS